MRESTKLQIQKLTAARNHHILIKNILAKALGQPVARARETNPTTEDDVNAVLLGLDQEDGIGGTGAKEQERRFELENNNDNDKSKMELNN